MGIRLIMKKLLLFALITFSGLAQANCPNFVDGAVLAAAQLNGALNAPCITGGTINGIPLGATVPITSIQNSGPYTQSGNSANTFGGTVSAAGITGTPISGSTVAGTTGTFSGMVTGAQITSNIATGTAPFIVTSTTPVANLTAANATTATNQSGGTVSATTGSFSGQVTSTVASGTAPFVVTSPTPVANLSIGGNAATATTATNQSGGTVNAITGTFNGDTTILIPGTSSITSLVLGQSGMTDANGANFKLIGNGTVTPSKTIRVLSGTLQFLNDAYSQVIFTLNDGGNGTFTGTVTASPATTSGQVVTLGQVSNIAPQTINYSSGGVAASTTYGQTFTFTAPSNGWVMVNCFWGNNTATGMSDAVDNIIINGSTVNYDQAQGAPGWMLSGFLYVTSGTAVSVTVNYVVGTTALTYQVYMRGLIWFNPSL